MVNRFSSCRFPRSSRLAAIAVGAFVVALPAQETPTPATPTPAAADPTPPPAAPQSPQLGRIVVEKAPLRCWPGTAVEPPMFEDVLGKDQVVGVGRSENGFRAIVLPLGPIGYVSRKFTDASADGVVKTKGSKVAFRYRPRSSEAPVTTLPAGTVLHVVAEQPDWYRVRVPSIEAWVPEAEVQVGDQADAALATAYAELRTKHETEVKARLDQIAAAKKLEEQNAIDLAAVRTVQEAFTAEMAKPVTEQKYEAINESLEKIAAGLGPESAAKSAVEDLKKRIETQRWVAEATIVRDEKPTPVAAPVAEPKDRNDRFTSIGWLRYERRLGGPGVYFLEKGGRRQYIVSCNTGRYDLALFVDREVGVAGPRRRPAAESLSVLDAERLEVLGTTAP